MNRFEGQVAIVTGGALGIGGATARKFASEGARVLIADIDMDAALANTEGITAAGGVAQAIRCDVSSHDDILSMVGAASAVAAPKDNSAVSATVGNGPSSAESFPGPTKRAGGTSPRSLNCAARCCHQRS